MKIATTKRIADKLQMMMEAQEMSAAMNRALTNVIATSGCVPDNLKQWLEEAREIRENGIAQGAAVDSEEKIVLLNLMESQLEASGIRGKERRWMMELLDKESLIFDAKEFAENPYFKNIKFENQAYGDFELAYDEMRPYELQIYDAPCRLASLPVDVPRIGCFTENFRYPLIYQKSIGRTWMSVTPNEVFTMQEPIRRAKGKVLTLGCGMGYFAYMASRKEDVDSVTIVEIEDDVIKLFENYILPQFENAHKIKIVKGDALAYVKQLEDGVFDYCFADIWLGIDDVESFFAAKEIGRKFKKTKTDYWIENSIATLISEYVWLEIIECFVTSIAGASVAENAPGISSEEESRKLDYVKRLLSGVEITRPEHLDYYLNPKNMMKLIRETEEVF